MHAQDTRNQFIKLRAEGCGLSYISERLNIPKSTLWVWDHQEQDRIHQLKLIAQDQMDEDYDSSRECELGALYTFEEHLTDSMTDNLCKRAKFLSIQDNWKLLREVRAEIQKLRLKPLLTKDGQPVPPDPTLLDVENVEIPRRHKPTPGPVPLPSKNSTSNLPGTELSPVVPTPSETRTASPVMNACSNGVPQ